MTSAELLRILQDALPGASPAELYVAAVDAALSPFAEARAVFDQAMDARRWTDAERALDALAEAMGEGHPIVVGERVTLTMLRD